MASEWLEDTMVFEQRGALSFYILQAKIASHLPRVTP
jgi:hypothetical protein